MIKRNIWGALTGITAGVLLVGAGTACADSVFDFDGAYEQSAYSSGDENLFTLNSSSPTTDHDLFMDSYVVGPDLNGIPTPPPPNPVPIPAAVWLFGSALVGVAGVGYRRKVVA